MQARVPDGDRQRWNQEYAAGRWDFLSSPLERTRLSLVAGMLRCAPEDDVLDLGSGPGHLLDCLPAWRAARYVAVDIADEALARVARREPQARTVRASLSEFEPHGHRVGAIIASEVLTYEDDSVAQLARIVAAYQHVGQVIVSVLGPHPDKPNWTRGSQRVWRALESLGWPRVQSATLRNDRTGVTWELADLEPG